MAAGTQEPFQRVGPQQAQDLIAEGAKVIDVREPKEQVQDGRVADSELVPLNSFLSSPKKYLSQDNVVFLCKVGQRSAIACEMAAAVGLTKLYNLEGGIEAWKKQGLPVEYPQA
ncbi:MAG: rhodanese-like domain-containing protein [Chloroflexota bacterium]|nr:rhodanese-like domain-containing protein [Chloroflexota bacterium]